MKRPGHREAPCASSPAAGATGCCRWPGPCARPRIGCARPCSTGCARTSPAHAVSTSSPARERSGSRPHRAARSTWSWSSGNGASRSCSKARPAPWTRPMSRSCVPMRSPGGRRPEERSTSCSWTRPTPDPRRRRRSIGSTAWRRLPPHCLVYLETDRDTAAVELPPGWRFVRARRSGQVGYHLASRHRPAEGMHLVQRPDPFGP